jgi:predicted RNase H-like HicB family nuclease
VRYTVLLEVAPEGGYTVFVPTLGLVTQGNTFQQALSMSKDVIQGYLECLTERGEVLTTETSGDHFTN